MRSALVVTVYDQNPDTAALIANDIVNYIDSLNRKPVIEANKNQLNKYKQDLESRYRALDSLIKKIPKGGISDRENVNQIINTDMMRTYNNLKEVETRMSVLNENFKTLYIIEKASPMIKKAKPVRWLIITGITAGSLFLTFIFIVLINQYSRQNKQLTEKTFFKS
jgi:LPS O-antigen subunit length determinant protein (WzzB/FepE family)